MKSNDEVYEKGYNREESQRPGFKPVKGFRTYRRNLPHWEQPGSAYLITFRSAEGFVLSDEAKELVLDCVQFHADKKYELYAGAVMENHVHLVLRPLEKVAGSSYSLAEIMHSIKSYSANRIQRTTSRRGSVWEDENLDRIIRNEDDWLEKLNYVIFNPVKAGLVERPEDYRWLYFVGAQ